MNKIYEFPTVGGTGALRISEQQPPSSVTLSFHQGDQDIIPIILPRQEFEELCRIQFRLEFSKAESEKPLLAVPSYAESLTA